MIHDVIESEDRQQARDDANAKIQRLDAYQTELDAAVKDADAITELVLNATNDTSRADAERRLLAVRGKKAELEVKIAQLRAMVKADRARSGIHLSPECLDNPLAEGCS